MIRSMSRTNIEIDDELVERVMHIYRLPTKKAAVEFALKSLVGNKTRKDLLKLEGMGWEGDLDQMRRSRVDDLWS
jgi:Arc/MetJ family transcription regulator